MFIVYPSFEKSLEEQEGEIKEKLGNHLRSLLSVRMTVVNQTLLGQSQSRIALNFPRDSHN